MAARKAEAARATPVVETRCLNGTVGGRVVAVTYQLELVRCGRKTCRCHAGGASHGPYWYAYYRRPSTGRNVSRYVGREFRKVDDRDPL